MVESRSQPHRSGAVPPARSAAHREPPTETADTRVPDTAGTRLTGAALRPDGVHDLRTGAAPSVLRYGAADILVVAGLPGAGKSTLMARCVDAAVIDSQHVREWYAGRLPARLPYPAFRPFVRVTHYARLGAALCGGGPLAVHDCGTMPFVRSSIARLAAYQGRDVHLLFLDVDTATARAGQHARGR
ncbi:MAG: hypothetical protein HOV68_01465, partial [Streptomycetaceae bacterium]|nr:hypothetical protein [Streptomycetaceae bacterium]